MSKGDRTTCSACLIACPVSAPIRKEESCSYVSLMTCHVLCTCRHIGKASPWRKVIVLERQSTTLHTGFILGSKWLPKARLVSMHGTQISIKGQKEHSISTSWTPTIFRTMPPLFMTPARTQVVSRKLTPYSTQACIQYRAPVPRRRCRRNRICFRQPASPSLFLFASKVSTTMGGD